MRRDILLVGLVTLGLLSSCNFNSIGNKKDVINALKKIDATAFINYVDEELEYTITLSDVFNIFMDGYSKSNDVRGLFQGPQRFYDCSVSRKIISSSNILSTYALKKLDVEELPNNGYELTVKYIRESKEITRLSITYDNTTLFKSERI